MSKKYIYLMTISSLLLTLNGCSSIFGEHAYNDDFGIVENSEADKQLEKEELITTKEVEKYNDEVNNMTEFKPEEGTFFAEDWVQPEPIITYHYDGDPKFYREDELPKNKGRLGNVTIKVPSSMTKEEALAKFGGI